MAGLPPNNQPHSLLLPDPYQQFILKRVNLAGQPAIWIARLVGSDFGWEKNYFQVGVLCISAEEFLIAPS
jgi:hypothetical protein